MVKNKGTYPAPPLPPKPPSTYLNTRLQDPFENLGWRMWSPYPHSPKPGQTEQQVAQGHTDNLNHTGLKPDRASGPSAGLWPS